MSSRSVGSASRTDSPPPDGELAAAALQRAQVAAELDVVELLTSRSPEEALERANKLEQLALEHGDEHLQLRALLVQADVQGRQGQSVASGRLLRSVNRWAAEHEDRYLLARSHRLLALFFAVLGDDIAFLEHAIHGVEMLTDDVRPALRADHLMALGMAQGRLGTPEGRASLTEAARLSEQLEDRYRQVQIMNNLAYLEHQAGEHQRALVAVGRLRALSAEHGVELVAMDLDTIGRVYLEVGCYAEAEQVLQQFLDAEQLSAEAGSQRTGVDADEMGELTLTLAEVQRRRGSLGEAEVTLGRCRALCAERSLNGVLIRVRQEQSELYAAQGRFAEAFAEHKLFYQESQQASSDARIARARTLQTVFDFEQARRTSQRFEEMAFRDPLTNLYNRRFVDVHLPNLLGASADPTQEISVAFIDLDHFKRINDTLSHHIGDQVLRQIATLLTDAAPDPGFVARMGGEEFLLVLPGADHHSAVQRCEELQASIRTFDWAPITGPIAVRASIGLITALARRCEQGELLAAADRNVYAAKSAGRNQTVATPVT